MGYDNFRQTTKFLLLHAEVPLNLFSFPKSIENHQCTMLSKHDAIVHRSLGNVIFFPILDVTGCGPSLC